MHPQLTEKNIICKDFIEALELCHRNSWARLTGGCNEAKTELNLCLRKARLNRAANNREMAKTRKDQVNRKAEEFKADN
ncbi:UPF0287-domain-containing protein [Rickenella mellea]|uniref:COX assembly mitochondrial protein n=1 Tax=Rickenella mellea TaxID=50990 RepID=A0A4Y7QJN6_9AGAM|nr:UPF0287-domain-containing protein [Rickenella mellea]